MSAERALRDSGLAGFVAVVGQPLARQRGHVSRRDGRLHWGERHVGLALGCFR